MKKIYKILQVVVFICVSVQSLHYAESSIPITTDSRIKTFVYNENEVFHLTLHYGYQSNIEFAKNEEIETLSVGNSYSWKITPVGRRLFLKALEGAAHTNMTVITNKRTYQFELQSKTPDDKIDEELVYVVRFFYPSVSFDKPLPQVDSKRFLPEPTHGTPSYNFNYSISGPESLAPLKVFDDGKSTFLKFRNNNAVLPHFFIVDNNGLENRTTYARQGEYIVIKRIFNKLALRLNDDVVHVFNDLNQPYR